jgi:hypothetical protein
MTDQSAFETRLASRLVAHVARGSRPFDAMAIASAAAAAAPRASRWGTSSLRVPTARRLNVALAVLVLAGLLLALIGAALLAGRQPDLRADVIPAPSSGSSATPTTTTQPQSPAPAIPAGLLVVTAEFNGCPSLDAHAIDEGSTRRLISCGERLSIAPDGSKAAIGGNHGLGIIDLRDGHQVDFIETGEYVFPVAWSPRGRWLEWAACGPKDKRGACTVVIGSQQDTRRNPLPEPTNGFYWGGTMWLKDESRLIAPTQDGLLIGDADGSNLKPFSPVGQILDWSPDASGYVYAWGPYENGHTTLVDAWLASIDGSDRRNLTNVEPGTFVADAAWSPDGRTLAFIRHQIAVEGQGSTNLGTFELWLRAADGSLRRLESAGDFFIPAYPDAFRIHWSPDGSRLAIETATGRIETSIDTLIVPIDGSATTVIRDARRPDWSRDGQSIAVVGTTGPSSHRENEKPPPATIDVANADGSNRRVVAVPTGDLDGFYFVWGPQ